MMLTIYSILLLAGAASSSDADAKSSFTREDAAIAAESAGVKSWVTEIVRATPVNEIVFFTYQSPKILGVSACSTVRSEFVSVIRSKAVQTTLMNERVMVALRSCDGIGARDFRPLYGDATALRWDDVIAVLYKNIPAFGGHGVSAKFASPSLMEAFQGLNKSDFAHLIVRSPSDMSVVFYSRGTRPDLIEVRINRGPSGSASVFVDIANGPDPSLTKGK